MNVYFDNSATTPLRAKVIDSINDCMKNHYGNSSSSHSYGRDNKSLLENARKSIASFINANENEIVFTSGGSESNNSILRSCVRDLGVKTIISSPILTNHFVKLPSVMGYLIAGVLIGPYGWQLIGDIGSVKHLAEIGVILLLFVIGLEFSLTRLLKDLISILGVGGLQLTLTAGVVAWVLHIYGFSQSQSIAFGFIIALSSTAIVLKMITDLAEIDTLQGKLCIGTLLFQDICVVPIMLVMPLLAQAGATSTIDFSIALFESLAAVFSLYFLSKLIIP